MPGCCAIGCTNRYSTGFRMCCFPRDPDRRKLWSIKVKRKNWIPSNSSSLCEVHFAPEMWEKDRVDGKRKLKSNAIPTIFSYVPLKIIRKPPLQRPFKVSKILVNENDQAVTWNELENPRNDLETEGDKLVSHGNESESEEN